MNEFSSLTQPQMAPGVAIAEDGLVILDGPDGLAITMTADAARKTAHSLIAAAELAEQQIAENGPEPDVRRLFVQAGLLGKRATSLSIACLVPPQMA